MISEDDEKIRNLIATFLQELCYRFLTAVARYALEKIGEHKNKVDIINGIRGSKYDFLAKPYPTDKLLKKLRQMLDQR